MKTYESLSGEEKTKLRVAKEKSVKGFGQVCGELDLIDLNGTFYEFSMAVGTIWFKLEQEYGKGLLPH